MSEGVEWALHCCLNLGWVGTDRAVTATRLAGFYDLPAAYLNKQLQALARAGILSSTSGPRGGFRLARPLEQVTLMDVVTAIEGADEAFRCTEIRRRGPQDLGPDSFASACLLDQAMNRAELAWRRELAAQTLGAVRDAVERDHPGTPDRVRHHLAP